MIYNILIVSMNDLKKSYFKIKVSELNQMHMLIEHKHKAINFIDC